MVNNPPANILTSSDLIRYTEPVFQHAANNPYCTQSWPCIHL